MATLVSSLSSYLRRTAKRRRAQYVTADDAQRYLDQQNFPTYAIDSRLSLIRRALSEPTFSPVGTVNSRRPAARGRRITAWRAR